MLALETAGQGLLDYLAGGLFWLHVRAALCLGGYFVVTSGSNLVQVL